MMRMKTIVEEPSPENRNSGGGAENEWEMRPGGMLVQKRNPDSDQNRLPPPPTIRVRVKYGSMYHEINISSQATFGELKKMLSGPTGVHHEDQKLLFKDKERDSKTFLDVVGVKDKSKIVLIEDLISQEKRILETRKIAKMEKSAKIISEISLEVDRLAGQVSAYESVISKGGKVGEKQVVNLIELLMNQLLKLDGIIADGDVKLQRKMQVQRVQKCVETLDVLKLKNSTSSSNGTHISPKPKQQPSNLLDILTVKKSVPSSNGTHISPKPQQQQSSSLSDMLNAKKSVPSSHRTDISPKPQQQQSSSLLDMLSVTKSVPSSNGTHISPKLKQQQQSPIQKNEQRYSAENKSTQAQYPQSRRTIGHVPIILQQEQQTARNSVPIILQQEQQTARNSAGGSVVITTQWETFDPIPAPKPVPPTTSKHPQFTWDLL